MQVAGGRDKVTMKVLRRPEVIFRMLSPSLFVSFD
jgi:hypothetical protein